MARDALVRPIRKMVSATHFKVELEPGGGVPKWVPCSPEDLASVQGTWLDLGWEDFKEPTLELEDLMKAAERTRSVVVESEIEKYAEWRAKFCDLPGTTE